MKPCVFFDRDGIVNESPGPGYVENREEFILIPAFIDALEVVTDLGYAAVIITNQRGVSRGIMTMQDVDAIHHYLRDRLHERSLSLLDIVVCPHPYGHPDRKPSPTMIVRAAAEHQLDLNNSWMIGDQESDVEAGRRAGCKTVLVNSGVDMTAADYHLTQMRELPSFLKKMLIKYEHSSIDTV